MLRSMHIANKIWLSLSILIIGYFSSMVFGYVKGKDAESRLHIVSEYVFSATRYSQSAQAMFDEQIKLYRDAVMMGNADLLKTAQEKATETIQALQSIIGLANLDSRIITEVQQTIDSLKSFSKEAHAAYTTMTKDEDNSANVDMEKLAGQTRMLQEKLNRLSQGLVNNLKSELSSVSDSTAHQRKLNVTVFAVVVFGSVGLIWIMVRRFILQPIHQTVGILKEIAKGDLSVRLPEGKDEIGVMGATLNTVVESLDEKAKAAAEIAVGNLRQDIQVASEKDSLGKALQTMINSLNDMVTELNLSAEQVNAGSRQVSDSSQSLSQGATEQASSLQEITSSMSQIGAQTRTNAENASQANQLAIAACESGRKGTRQMSEMVAAMNDINASSGEIGKIIKTIDDIAFQTNLLALNAAVEAARAGKHGKGFAVVAQEVRTLAARSAKAARETAELIESSIHKISAGSDMASKTETALAEINESATKVAGLVGEIAAASNEQAQGISQVNQGLSQIDSVTQRNTASAEETSAAAEQLTAQAEHVRQLIGRFKIKGQHKTVSSEKTYPSTNVHFTPERLLEWGKTA